MWQAIVVGLIVLAAVLYAAWTLLPATLRLRAAQRVGHWARRPGRPAWLGRAATSVETAARARLGGCGDCGAVQGPPEQPGNRPKR